jgi:adenylosuccinate lyase
MSEGHMPKISAFNANTALMALSPLDGRYQSKLMELRQFYSEYGLIYHRLQVEIEWLKMLASHRSTEIKPLSKASLKKLEHVLKNFTPKEAVKIKNLEKKTQHDVKAVEYYLKTYFERDTTLRQYIPALHFALTSEDVNNLAYGLMLKSASTEVVQPLMQKIIKQLSQRAKQYASLPMLSRTHGQPASPTTLGKEYANFASRLQRQLNILKKIPIMGKCNGAVGHFNAHKVAYPTMDWMAVSDKFVRSLGLTNNFYTTQVEPHDGLAEWLQALIRFNSVALDCVKDIWGYISLGYFVQKKISGTIGSSTMPHKINPIHFENAEGNLGLANALAQHCVIKLPISRFQRDLSDSTVLRNLGCILGYSVLAYQSIITGLSCLSPNKTVLHHELNEHWEVLTEAIQVVMRRYGIPDAYEQIKAFSHGKQLTQSTLHAFIDTLKLKPSVKDTLKRLTPDNYLGEAVKLAGQAHKFVD